MLLLPVASILLPVFAISATYDPSLAGGFSFEVNGCVLPSKGVCVGDFLAEVNLHDTPTHEIPESFISTRVSKGPSKETSSLLSNAHAATGNHSTTLQQFSGLMMDVMISHGETLWPCTLTDGSLQPMRKYDVTKNYKVNATFTQDTSGEDIYTCNWS
jgi:hypothetical protein